MSHTPGPWSAHAHESTDTYTIHVAGRSWESWAVAHVGDCTDDEANARLIAAAPDLLEALKNVIRGVPDTWDGVIKARAAIAKAEGKE